MTKTGTIGIIGGGAWGTALAETLCRASLGEAAFAQRLREGARLSDADIAPLAFATDDAA